MTSFTTPKSQTNSQIPPWAPERKPQYNHVDLRTLLDQPIATTTVVFDKKTKVPEARNLKDEIDSVSTPMFK